MLMYDSNNVQKPCQTILWPSALYFAAKVTVPMVNLPFPGEKTAIKQIT